MASMCCLLAAPPDDATRKVAAIVVSIQRADYEGDRAALARLHVELKAFVDDRTFAAHVRYWRGFARWRRAFNGFNDRANRQEIDADSIQAAADFHKANGAR